VRISKAHKVIRQMATQYDKVVDCLSKPSSQRRQTEVLELIPWFCKKSEKLFQSLKPGEQTDNSTFLCNCCNLKAVY
jgi:two-component SAPR family response regulator